MIWDLFQTKIKCEKLSLYSFWNLSCICMPVHAYALLECAYAYMCMRAHTLGFPMAFLFQKYFYSSKNKFIFYKYFHQVNFHEI